jgi:hypothetical protein
VNTDGGGGCGGDGDGDGENLLGKNVYFTNNYKNMG